MTDTPPPHETGADVADTPAKKAKRDLRTAVLAAAVLAEPGIKTVLILA